jgi:hypothetical protein
MLESPVAGELVQSLRTLSEQSRRAASRLQLLKTPFQENCSQIAEGIVSPARQRQSASEIRLCEVRFLSQRRFCSNLQQFAERRVEPNSGSGQAITYMQNHWAKLTLLLRQPGAPLDNNLCERPCVLEESDSPPQERAIL